MRRKSDPRIEQTKEKIKKNFIQLLSEKLFCNITVMEISHRAHINRSTFYAHYKDTYELLIDCASEGTSLHDKPPTREDIYINPENFIDRVQNSMEFDKKNKDVFQVILSTNLYSPYLQSFVKNKFEHQIALQRAVQDDDSSYLVPDDILAHFCIAGINQLAYLWVKGDLPYTSREISVHIAKLNLLLIAVMTGVDPNRLPISTAKGSQTLRRVENSIVD